MKKDVYVYRYKDAAYVNLTNRCTNDCVFCLRRNRSGVGEYNLWLEREPEAKDVIAALKEQEEYRELVFCGFGEPTIRLDVLLKVAEYAKRMGKKVRVDTNGHASAFHHRDAAAEMKGRVDAVSVSLNAVTPKMYQKRCRSRYGEQAFFYMLEFAGACVKNGIETTLTIMDISDEDEIQKAESIAKKIGATLRIRHFIK